MKSTGQKQNMQVQEVRANKVVKMFQRKTKQDCKTIVHSNEPNLKYYHEIATQIVVQKKYHN